MQIDDMTSSGYVRRWTLIDGRPRCVEDAIPASDAGAVAALQRNAAVRAMIAAVEALEAARAVTQPDNGEALAIPDPDWTDPEDGSTAPLIANPDWSLAPRMIESDDGEVTDPRWIAWDDAQAVISGASAPVLAVADWRAAEPDGAQHETDAADAVEAEGAGWEAARAAALAELDRLAALPLDHDPRPVPPEISDRQFFQALALAGLISQAEALAAVQTGALPAPIAAIVDGLPDQFGARMLLSGATTFERANPLTDALGGALGYSPAQTDELFRAAAAL